VNLAGAKEFLKELGITKFTHKGNWVNAHCPLAKHKHESGKDSRPSFGVSVSEEETSVWKCFTCSPSPRPMFSLIQDIWRATGHYPRAASLVLMNGDNATHNEPITYEPHDSWKSYAQRPTDKLPDDVIDIFPLLSNDVSKPIMDYLVNTRRIEPDVIELIGVRCWVDENLILFPYTNNLGEITLLKARSYKEKKMFNITPEYVGQPWLRFRSAQATGSWLGLHLINWQEPVYIVEGELDQMRLLSLGRYNTIAAGTSGISQAQLDSLHGINYRLGFDADDSGRAGAAKVYRMLSNKNIVSVLDWSVAGCKDPGDITSEEQIVNVMEHLRLSL